MARATDPEVRTTLARIADDESKHAALAWRTLGWALERGGEAVRRMLARARHELVTEHEAPRLPDGVDPALWSAHGRLDDEAMAAAARDATAEIVIPMLDRLLEKTPRQRVTPASSA
jgi:hypothetical protein